MTDNIAKIKLAEVRKAEADRDAPDGLAAAPPGAPMENARLFIARRYKGERDLLVCQGGVIYAYDGRCWPVLEDDALRSQVYKTFEHAHYQVKNGIAPFSPNRSKVENIIDALKAIIHSDASATVPKWLDSRDDAPAAIEVVVCQNGLVNVTTRELMPHTPFFFQYHAVPFDFDPHAPSPARWHQFTGELFGDDMESVGTLQEWMGYVMSADTRQQKILLIIGPKRSGKGTIARTVTELLGSCNVVAPTLASLAQNFGLQPLIGKPLAIVGDARVAPRNGSTITERLLSISGEDALTVDRKNKDAWTVVFPTRIVILTNELPRLIDSAGALPSRFIVLRLTKSFYGKENINLRDTLKTELPGIFNWVIDGLVRLRQRGRFVQPKSAVELVEDLGNLSSPITAFVKDYCQLGRDKKVPKNELFNAWREWCSDNGHVPGSSNTFAKHLYAAFPQIRQARPTADDGTRQRVFEGIGCEF